MKQFLFFLFSLCLLQSHAQTLVGANNVANFKLDMTAIGATNGGDTTKGDAARIGNAMYQTSTRNFVLYLPAGYYKIDSTVYAYSNLTIKGAGMGKTFVFFDSAFAGSGAMFEWNGASNVTVEDITFYGSKKKINSFLKFNSSPNKCKNINIHRVEVRDAWVQQGFEFGATAANETHSLDLLHIWDCWIHRLGNPAQMIITAQGTDRTIQCIGINLEQTTLRATIEDNKIDSCSGDGITAYGWCQNGPVPQDAGNWLILRNYIANCLMPVEINGNRFGKNLRILYNTIRWGRLNGGFLVSIDSDGGELAFNKFRAVDRGALEVTFIHGSVHDNEGEIICYSDTSGGVPASFRDVDHNKIDWLQGYGFDNDVYHNKFRIDTSGKSKNPFFPDIINGIHICGTTTDPAYQDTAYRDVVKQPGYWNITHNTVTNFTHKSVDVSPTPAQYVNIIENTFISNIEQASPIEIFGNWWQIIGNTFNLNGCYPTNGNSCIKLNSDQMTTPVAIVANNVTFNAAWKGKWWYGGASATNIFK